MLKKQLFLIFSSVLILYAGFQCHASWIPDSDRLYQIGSRIQHLNYAKDTAGLILVSDSLQRSLKFHKGDSSEIADIYYYSGVCDLLLAKYNLALYNLRRCIELKKQLGIEDGRYENALFNAGIACTYLGDFIQVIKYTKEYASLTARLYGENAGKVAEAYSALAGASIECLDYEGFIDYSLRTLEILRQGKDTIDTRRLSGIYSTIGVGYARMGDYAKARIYLEKAELLIRENNLDPDENEINLINSLAYTYGILGLQDKEAEYFSRGIDLAVNNNSNMAFNLINNYANAQARSGNVVKGERLLARVANKAMEVYGRESRLYIEALNNYAIYLSDFAADTKKALAIYNILLTYLGSHENDIVLRSQVLSGYARVLYKTGENKKALVIIRDLLFSKKGKDMPADIIANPRLDSITVDRSTLLLIQLKYNILRRMYSESGNQTILEKAAETSELIISLIDKIRISITEEESRLILGDNFRYSYLNAIRDFELCYRKTYDRRFLEKAFEYAEKSKVAGLIASTRQMKAIQFHIPAQLAEREIALQREIGFYNSRISIENEKEKPDEASLAVWNQNLLAAVASRDALVLTFEKDYPEYFNLKYNSRVPRMEEIPSIIGRKYNYINYVLSDSDIYIFLINKKHQEMLTIRTDSSFMKSLVDFRNLLSDPSHSEAARTKFINYQKIGYDLYETLIEPVKKFLSSHNLLISSDNILSYLPFETFITSKYDGSDILYRKLNYLMNDYNISYAYSATFMNENIQKHFLQKNNLVAFAPSYSPTLNIDSLLTERQAGNTLLDLPYARQEAEYAADISNGVLYINDEAREDTYKSEAEKYSIIHLAMHAIINDQSPMNSAMIFAQPGDSINDGLLHTYEVYGIPLRSKMVVLSSCNTGNGLLSSGEGILSLARGFLYSGSQSVVMSLWQIEDRSGTEIIKMFYDNLRTGMSKSRALRKARHEYLKNSSQLRSHPYFWSALVVYGDNSAVYFPWNMATGLLLALIAAGTLLFIYLRKRKYS